MRATRRSGFGILAIIMFVGIIATLMALSFSTVMYANRVVRANETWRILQSVQLAAAIPGAGATVPVFRQRVGNNPGRISHLLGPVNSGDAVNFPDACNTTYSNANRDNSRQWAPFLAQAFDPAVGLPTPMGTVDNTFLFIDIPGPGVNWHLHAVIPLADIEDLEVLDQFDNNDGAAAGLVRWDNIVGSTARLLFLIPTDGSCG